MKKSQRKSEMLSFWLKVHCTPDIIESKSSSGSKTSIIKSHHNVGGLPKKMKLKLIEPLKNYFKDEVRTLGKSMNISKDILNRHPFLDQV